MSIIIPYPIFASESSSFFIAVSIGGKIGISPDGINWNLLNTVTTNNLIKVGFGNNTICATGPNPETVLVSFDGAQNFGLGNLTPDPATFYTLPFAYAFGKYWVGMSSALAYRSDDGINYSQVNAFIGGGTVGVQCACATNDMLIFGNNDKQILKTIDGINFTRHTITGFQSGADIYSLIKTPNYFIATGSTTGSTVTVARSANAELWSSVMASTFATRGAAWADGIGITVGDNSVINRTTDEFATFSPVVNSFATFFNGVASDGLNTFVIAGNGGKIFTSVDKGISFSSVTNPFGVSNITDIVYCQF